MGLIGLAIGLLFLAIASTIFGYVFLALALLSCGSMMFEFESITRAFSIDNGIHTYLTQLSTEGTPADLLALGGIIVMTSWLIGRFSTLYLLSKNDHVDGLVRADAEQAIGRLHINNLKATGMAMVVLALNGIFPKLMSTIGYGFGVVGVVGFMVTGIALILIQIYKDVGGRSNDRGFSILYLVGFGIFITSLLLEIKY